jgi:hypothetical protein
MDRKEKEGPVASAGMTISFKTRSRHVNINKVTASQDDDFVGVPTKNTLNKLALMGLCPVFSSQVRSHGKPGQVGEPGSPVRIWGSYDYR